MDKNFSGQNLNGHSFRGQDLRGADFSGCQLKSCDFREADLTGAKFYRATMGINGRRNLLKWASAFMLGVISGFVAWLLNYLFVFAANTIYQSLTGTDIPTEENYVLLSICSLYAASVCLSVFAALKYRDWRIVAGYHLVIILAIVGVGVGVGAAAVMTFIYWKPCCARSKASNSKAAISSSSAWSAKTNRWWYARKAMTA